MTAKGIPLADCSPQLEELIRAETLASDTDHEAVAGLEKAMKATARGNVPRAAKMFRDIMQRGALVQAAFDEAVTGRRKQQRTARNPRENTLNKAIREIVEGLPRITEPELLVQLNRLVDGEVIDEITDTEIFYFKVLGGKAQPIKISSLKDRLSRVKKKLNSC